MSPDQPSVGVRPTIVRRLYDWVLHWAHTPYGIPALVLLTFAESSFFPIPPDPLLVALCIAAPRRSLLFAAAATAASVLGGVAGYWIGAAKVNNVVYDENGVQVRTIPAIHADQSVSFILEWNGLKFAFSSDTLPNKWWLQHTKNADIAIHEAFIPPDLMMGKFGFTPSEAIFVGTQGHTYAAAFGKIMSMTRPRLAVAYHFQNDFDTGPAVRDEIRKTYDGPLDLATDYMVWNVTEDKIRTRMAVPNEESFPAPIQRQKYPPDSLKAYPWTQLSLSGVEPESAAVTNAMIEEFNERHGTDIKPAITGLPFRKR